MSNPFKTGDKVVRLNATHDGVKPGDVAVVASVDGVGLCALEGGSLGFRHQSYNLRAAIAGHDYDIPAPPFKVGDKVECSDGWTPNSSPMTVTKVAGDRVYTDNCDHTESPWYAHTMRLAAVTAPQPEANSGHLPDGSGVQKHSAGPIYPCVIVLRDKRLKGNGLFDYGLTSPRNHVPIWFSTLEAAHTVADIINKDIAP